MAEENRWVDHGDGTYSMIIPPERRRINLGDIQRMFEFAGSLSSDLIAKVGRVIKETYGRLGLSDSYRN